MAQFFQPIRKILTAINMLDLDIIAQEIARKPVFQKLVISLNTEGLPTSQLYELGQDSKGRTLESLGGGYTPFTKEIKQSKGQPIDRVTLKDTGDFYMSFGVTPYLGGFVIDADPQKDDNNLFERWGIDIIGLDDTNLQIIIEFYRNAIQEKIQTNLRRA